jgi:hypothetical protein
MERVVETKPQPPERRNQRRITMAELTPEQAAKNGIGLHYASREWNEAGRDADWTGVWPEINRDGKLTGDVVYAGDDYTFLNVEDEAMIAEDEARAGGWEVDAEEGRAYQPLSSNGAGK